VLEWGTGGALAREGWVAGVWVACVQLAAEVLVVVVAGVGLTLMVMAVLLLGLGVTHLRVLGLEVVQLARQDQVALLAQALGTKVGPAQEGGWRCVVGRVGRLGMETGVEMGMEMEVKIKVEIEVVM
jgi:hypothetical protein